MGDEDKKEFDIFYRASIYPEAEAIFSFRPQIIEQIKDDCMVVLDTNALLVPFTTGKDSLEQIGRIYKSLVEAKRLVVPGQVAREFAEHRVTKLKELYQQISRKKPTLSLGSYPLLDNVSDYQKAKEIENQLSDSLRDYSKAIEGILDTISGWYWNDPVSALYGEQFAADVVLDPAFDEEATKGRLETDTLYKLPPGYKDARKNDEGIGDLLIWQTILEVGRTHKKSVIFVSLDQKSDWLSQSEGRALYPRFELVDEFRRTSDGKSFHIVKFSSFLNLFGASEKVVEEVKKEEAQAVIESLQPPHRLAQRQAIKAEEAVFKWLWRQYPGKVRFAEMRSRIDFIVELPDGANLGADVKYFRHTQYIHLRIKDSIEALRRISGNESYSSLLLVLIASDEGVVFKLNEVVNEFDVNVPKLSITIGRLTDDDEFIALRTTTPL